MKNFKTSYQTLLFIVFLPLIFIISNYLFLYQNSVSINRSIIINILILNIIVSIIISSYFKNNSIYGIIISALSVGGLFFISILGIQIINPINISWLMTMEGDWSTHFIGWHFFRNESWHFPLGMFRNLHYPVGTSIGYTDSIPLMAFLFKPFTHILPDNFQYFGIWLLLCFCLQGVFGSLLIRTVSNNFIIQLLGSTIFVISPILLNRIGHPALCSHWILLAALWLYFRNWKNSPSLNYLCAWLFFIVISAFIHPYIVIMTLGVAFAFYLRLWIIDLRLNFRYSILNFSILVFSTLIIWYMIGYFQIGRISNYTARFLEGYYSMNLIAPINPLDVWSQITWSVFLKSWQLAAGGQYEGFNYFGVGIIILGLFGIYEFLTLHPKSATIKSLLPLALICTGFTLFALSVQVTLGDQIIFKYPTNTKILAFLSIFRASGRFFWIVYYFIMFLIISFLIRRNRTNMAISLLVIGLFFQISDFHKKYETYMEKFCQPEKNWNNPLISKFWRSIRGYNKIIFVPPGENEPAPYLPFAYVAANHGMAINTGYLARGDNDKINKYRENLLTNIENGIIDSDSIYILTPEYLEILKNSAKVPIICGTIDGFDVCLSNEADKMNPAIKLMQNIVSSQSENTNNEK